jgi:hypothetical protein
MEELINNVFGSDAATVANVIATAAIAVIMFIRRRKK